MNFTLYFGLWIKPLIVFLLLQLSSWIIYEEHEMLELQTKNCNFAALMNSLSVWMVQGVCMWVLLIAVYGV